MRVPQAQQTVQIENPSGYRQQITSDANAFGANVAQAGMHVAGALNNVGEVAGNIAYREKQKNDIKAVMDATNAMTMDVLDYSSKLYAFKGNDAAGAFDKAKEFYNQTFDKYAANLSNDQLLAFQQHMRPNVISMLRDARTHETQERNASLKLSYKAGQETNLQGIAASWTNPDTINPFLAKNDQLVDLQGKMEGWTPEVIDYEKSRLRTLGVHNAVVNAMKDNNYDAAAKLLETYKQVMDPSVHADLSAKVQGQIIKTDTDSIADNAVKGAMRQDGTVDRELAHRLADEAIDKAGVGASPSFNGIKSVGEKFLGQAYVWGGTSPETGFDCSGFTQYVFKQNGVNLPRLANDQFEHLYQQGRTFTDASQLKPGDLVFSNTHTSQEFDADNPRHITHVGIYMGNGKVLQDGSSGVSYVNIEAMGDVVGYGSAESGNAANVWTVQRKDALKNRIDNKIADINRIKRDQDQEYRHTLAEQIDAADSLEAANAVIDSATKLPLSTRNSLKASVKQKFNILAGPKDEEQWFWAHYEKTGLYADLKGIQQFNERLAQGNTGDIKQEQWDKYNEHLAMVNKYWAYSSGGKYVPGVGVAKQQPSGASTNMGEARKADVDPVSAWIKRARDAGIPADTIRQLVQKEYGNKYDAELW